MAKAMDIGMAKAMHPKISFFNDGGRHARNISHKTNPLFWSFFHPFNWFHLDKYADMWGKVAELALNIKILAQKEQICRILEKNESAFKFRLDLQFVQVNSLKMMQIRPHRISLRKNA